MDLFNFQRRATTVVHVGAIDMGADNPIRVQSMTTTNTNDTDACVAQAEDIIKAGGELVRLTTQGTKEAENLQPINARLRAEGYDTPLVADVHFNPNVADVAARFAEKVRVNPGNYVDPARRFIKQEYTDEEYARELKKIEDRFIPFLRICKENHTAVRIGVNHGSLSDRIRNRYGDTPAGIVESCMEFLRICKREDFNDVVISVKASNTVIMVQSVRMLVAAMDKEDMHYPLHLGVTEAGEGEDGRIKSAVGIGGSNVPVVIASQSREQASTVADTSQQPADYLYVGSQLPEKPVDGQKYLVDYDTYLALQNAQSPLVTEGRLAPVFPTDAIPFIGMTKAEVKFLVLKFGAPTEEYQACLRLHPEVVVVCVSNHQNRLGDQRALVHELMNAGLFNPVVFAQMYRHSKAEKSDFQLEAAADMGALMIDGLTDGLWLLNDGDIPQETIVDTAFGILQAARLRVSKTEYISCPGCGRTLYDLRETIAKIREATKDMKGLKIGIMGCIVNGPGEMADADYGYVGAGVNKVSLYRGQVCVEKNIPQEVAVEHLLALIKKGEQQ